MKDDEAFGEASERETGGREDGADERSGVEDVAKQERKEEGGLEDKKGSGGTSEVGVSHSQSSAKESDREEVSTAAKGTEEEGGSEADRGGMDGVDAGGGDGGADAEAGGGGKHGPVTAERKAVLLGEARRDRLAWIGDWEATFQRPSDAGHPAAHSDGLSLLVSSRAVTSMPSTVRLLSTLYGVPLDDALQAVLPVQSPRTTFPTEPSSLTPEEVKHRIRLQLEAAAPRDAADSHGDDQPSQPKDVFVDAYRLFIRKLRSPEGASLAQNVKQFVRTFHDLANDARSSLPTDSLQPAAADGDNDAASPSPKEEACRLLATSIQSFVESTLRDLSSSSFWNDFPTNDKGPIDSITISRCLQLFVNAKCSEPIRAVLNDDTFDHQMRQRLSSLQFINASHLDIDSLSPQVASRLASEIDTEESDDHDALDVALSRPIASLRSMGCQYSPGEMLSAVLDVYRGVNEVLSSAMSLLKGGDSLPGADDVLPTLILTVLRARPATIISDLHFIEYFATPEQLRGEAGYAYTNLYSAVQFLRDIDLGEKDGKTSEGSALSISPAEFRAGLERCRQAAIEEKGLVAKAKETEFVKVAAETAELDVDSPNVIVEEGISVPASEIRSARLRGEVVDVDWALQWQQQHRLSLLTTPAGEDTNQHSEGESKQIRAIPFLPPAPLPLGFTRSYSFLASEPDEIRVVDVPLLLAEYRMLVQATEALLAERTSRYTAEIKRHMESERERLERDAAAVDNLSVKLKGDLPSDT